jgi:hypothetical protein
MAWPESLTADQQTNVIAYANVGRTISQLAIQLVLLTQQYNTAWGGGIATLVNSLQSTDLIPNTSGLPGSQDLDQADMGNIATWAALICNSANTVAEGSLAGSLAFGTFVKAAGPQT